MVVGISLSQYLLDSSVGFLISAPCSAGPGPLLERVEFMTAVVCVVEAVGVRVRVPGRPRKMGFGPNAHNYTFKYR